MPRIARICTGTMILMAAQCLFKLLFFARYTDPASASASIICTVIFSAMRVLKSKAMICFKDFKNLSLAQSDHQC